jgi:hypothetical protein
LVFKENSHRSLALVQTCDKKTVEPIVYLTPNAE